MTTTTRPRPRRRLWVAIGIIVAIVLAALALDRIAAAYTTSRITEAIESDLGAQEVDVTIAGFPFLLQAVTGSLDDVAITADRLEHDGLTVVDLVGAGSGVSLQGESIETFAATATVPIETMQTLIDDALTDVPGWALGDVAVTVREGNLELSATAIEVLDVAVDVQPIPRGRSLSFDLVNVRLAGATVTLADIPFGMGDALAEQIADLEVELTMLPVGVEVTELAVVPGGASLTLEGHDVQLGQG